MESRELNLVLKYRVGGEILIKGAASISIDGAGSLTLTDPQTGSPERIPLKAIEVLSIQSLPVPSWSPLLV